MKFINPTTLSAVDDNLREVMGEEIYSLYHCLQNDLLLIIEKWSNYKYLYVDRHNNERVGSQAGTFFMIIEDALRNDIAISIARLHDNGKRNNSDSLSFQKLISAVKSGRPAQAKKLRSLITKLPSSFKSLRDKMLAHRDFVFIQQSGTTELNAAEVDARIAMMSNALNVVLSVYDTNTSVEYDTVFGIGGARTLISEIGIAYRFRAYFETYILEHDTPTEELLHILHGPTQTT